MFETNSKIEQRSFHVINPDNFLHSTETILIQGIQSNINMPLQKIQNIIQGPEANTRFCSVLEVKLAKCKWAQP